MHRIATVYYRGLKNDQCYSGEPPHPLIVTIGDNSGYILFLLYSYCATITGWEILWSWIPSITMVYRYLNMILGMIQAQHYV